MSMNLGTGIVMIVAGIALLTSTTVRKAEAFEYPMAMFLGELGLVFVAGEVIPSQQAAVIVQAVLVLGMIPTAVLWMKRVKEFRRGVRAQKS